jgi:hypothetical protein
MAQIPSPGIDDARIPPLTPGEATMLKHCFLRDLAANIGLIVDSGRADGAVIFAPPKAEPLLRQFIQKSFKLFPQRGDTPADILSKATHDLFSRGFSSVCLVNSDSPTVPRAALEFGVESLSGSGDHIVLGPLDRGGYYLIGFKQEHRDLLERVPSVANIMVHMKARTAAMGVKVEMLPPGFEVTDARGLNRLCKELFSPDSQQRTRSAPYTKQYLARLLEIYGADQLSPDLARGA